MICFDAPSTIFCACKCSVCAKCQELSTSPKCVQCSLVLSSNVLGTKLTKLLLKPWEEEEFWKREESLLANTQILLDWEIEMNRLKAQQRFGLQPRLPPKPKLNLSTDDMFPCPSLTCRGFVGSKGTCGTCKTEICTKCREIHNDKCNPETLASLQAILHDSRACPKCSVSIHKTVGCDHMFCTNCRTHWHWETRKVLKESTNGHYNSSPIFSDAATLPFASFVHNECTERALQHLHVHHSAMRDLWSQALTSALVIERKQIMFALQSLYDSAKLRRKHEELLINLRLKFLKKEKTLEKTKESVWKAEKNLEKHLAIGHILYVNLEQTHFLHRQWMADNWSNTEVYVKSLMKFKTFVPFNAWKFKVPMVVKNQSRFIL